MLLQSVPLAVNKFLFATLPFDPVADLAPVSLICDYPNVMAVPMSSPAHIGAGVHRLCQGQSRQGQLCVVRARHLGASVRRAVQQAWPGSKLLHIPYRGAGPALNDLIPGRVDVMFNNIGAVMPLIQGGKLRALGVTSLKRATELPDVPTVSEAGVPGFDVIGLVRVLRAGQDAARGHRASCMPTRSRRSPIRRSKARLEQLGVGVIGSSPEELRAYLKAEMDKWGVIIKEAGIKVE